MKAFMKFLIGVLVIIILNGCVYDSMENKYQTGADEKRLNDLYYYGTLLKEYEEITGTYPFVGQHDSPVYVVIANSFQQSMAKDYIAFVPEPKIVKSETDLKNELERVLKREIVINHDPQRVASGFPNIYVYMANNDEFYFAVHLYHNHGVGAQLAKHYYKVQMTNYQGSDNGCVPIEKVNDGSFLSPGKVTDEEFKLHQKVIESIDTTIILEGMISTLQTKSTETFLSYDSSTKHLTITEYGISGTKETYMLAKQLEELKTLVESLQFTKARYGVDSVHVEREILGKESSEIVTTICAMKCYGEDHTTFKAILESILNREVAVTKTDNVFSICYYGSDVNLNTQNGTHFIKDDIHLIIYTNTNDYIDLLVFEKDKHRLDKERSYYPYLDDSVIKEAE